MKIDLSIPARDAGLARVGMAATLDDIDAFPGRTFDGKVARFHSMPSDSSGRALVAEVHVADPEQFLKPGMLARVSLVLGEHHEAVLIPSEAVVEEEDGGEALRLRSGQALRLRSGQALRLRSGQAKTFVYAVAGGTAKKIAVTTGWTQNGRTEIARGLAAGEKVIVSGQQRLSPEMKVRVVEEK